MEGASAQVNCTFQTSGFNGLSWYQQHKGRAPVFVSYDVLDGFQNRSRSSTFLRHSDGYSHLLLKELQMKDSATYLCAVRDTVTTRPSQLCQNSKRTTIVGSYISCVYVYCKRTYFQLWK
ncbi:T-cell receptor alpha chain V region 2B4 [Fukomys damarensis]|nr:T-cell receptor alpha chain V region 2B4 [Fukomys damarensis]